MEAELLDADREPEGHDGANNRFSQNCENSLVTGVSEQACKQHVYHGAPAAGRPAGRPPGSAKATSRRPAAEFTAGLKTELCEKAYAVLYFTHLSGDSRTLPASRKLGRVKEQKRAAVIRFP